MPVPSRRAAIAATLVIAATATLQSVRSLATPGPTVADAAAPTTVVISEFMASVATDIPASNTAHYDWLEVWNASAAPVDITGWHLTDTVGVGLFTFATQILQPGERVVVYASGLPALGPLHASFKLSTGGEYLGLTNAAGTVVHEYAPSFPPQAADVSYGLDPDGLATYLGTPTPGAANVAAARRAAAPSFSVSGGLYSAAQSVAITTTEPGATIRYTTDGSVPTSTNGTTYVTAIPVSATTVLRAVAVAAGLRDSNPTTASYVFPADVVLQGPTPAGWPVGPVNGQVLDYEMDPDVVGGQTAAVVAALSALPTISLVTDQANLTDPTRGIYVNAEQRGSSAERPVSVEILDPTGPDVQIDGGLRIRGGWSRRPANPKHSFRLLFNGGYDGPLQYDLFGTGASEVFDGIDLRTEQNHSWQEGNSWSTFARETWSRDIWARMGHPTTRSFWFHLYLNGRYWGLYEVEEQVDSRWAARELGGTTGAHDVIGDDSTNNYAYEVDAGNDTEWLQLWDRISDLVVDDAEYADIEHDVDLESLADYALLLAYTADPDAAPSAYLGNERANNWIAAGAPDVGIPWQFVPHDAEHSLGAVNHDVNENRTGPYPVGSADNTAWDAAYFHPGWLHQVLLSRPEYRAIVQARLAALTAPGGPFTETGARAAWDPRVSEVGAGVLAESARWGDAAGGPTYGPADWAAEVAWVETGWFAARTPILHAQVAARLAAFPPVVTTTTTTTTAPATTTTTPGTTTTTTTAPGAPDLPIVASDPPVLLAPAVRLGVVEEPLATLRA